MIVYILILIQQLIAGGTNIVAKGLTQVLNPSLILFLRSSIAAMIFTLWIISKRKEIKKINSKDIFYLLLLGLLNIPANQFLFLQSIKLTSPANVALAYSLSPLFVMLIATVFLKESINKGKIFGVVTAFVGVIVVLLNTGLGLAQGNILGDLLALVASASWAVYTVVGKKYSLKYGPIVTTAYSMIFGFLLFVPVFSGMGVPLELSDISLNNWLKILYLSVFSSAIAYAIWYYALSKKDASKVAIFNNIQPLLTAVLSAIFLDFTITPLYVLGGLMIIAGVIIAQKA